MEVEERGLFFHECWLVVVNEAIIELPVIYFVTYHFDWLCIFSFFFLKVINKYLGSF